MSSGERSGLEIDFGAMIIQGGTESPGTDGDRRREQAEKREEAHLRTGPQTGQHLTPESGENCAACCPLVCWTTQGLGFLKP